MKHIIIFVSLKIGELAGVGLLCFGFWVLGHWLDPKVPFYISTVLGLSICLVIAGVLIFLALLITKIIPAIICANWRWAKRISAKEKS